MIAVQAPPAVPPAAAEARCDSSSSQLTLATSLQAVKQNDPKTAEGLLDGELQRCPPSEPLGRALRVLRAELAAHDGDWARIRDVLDGVTRPQGPLGVTATFAAMRADAGLKDASAFDRERTVLAQATDAALTAGGKRVERFQAGGMDVSGYETPLSQGPFSRRIEFLIPGVAPFAYPRTVMLTDDRSSDTLTASLAARDPAGAPPAGTKTWFVDLYTCNLHVTLKQLHTPADAPPSYADVKAVVAGYLSGAGVAEGAAPPPEAKGACSSGIWLAPGVG